MIATIGRNDRRSLTNGVELTVYPKEYCRTMEVINITGAALRVYSQSGDATAYLEISDGFTREFPAYQNGAYRPTEIACYLLPAATGTAILIWR